MDTSIEQAAQGDIQSIKHHVFMPEVMRRYGLQATEKVNEAEYLYRAWYRDDKNPSVRVSYDEDRGWTFYDRSTGHHGDVLDFVQQYAEVSLNGAVGIVADMAGVASYQQQTMPVKAKRVFDPDDVPESYDSTTFDIVLHEKPNLQRDRGLARTWDLRTGKDCIYAPIYLDGEMVGCKIRRDDGTKMSVPGTTIKVLYTPKGRIEPGMVVICEGETDTWAVGALYQAAGVLSASLRPENVALADQITGPVYLAFDNDEAGQEATQAWAAYFMAKDIDVYLVPVPEGRDMSEHSPAEINTLIAGATSPVFDPDVLVVSPEGYRRPVAKGQGPLVSNFILRPQRRLVSQEEGLSNGYEVDLRGHDVVITEDDMLTTNSMKRWAIRHGAVWLGGANDHSRLSATLAHLSIDCQVAALTNVVGFHDGRYYLGPDETTNGNWVYTDHDFLDLSKEVKDLAKLEQVGPQAIAELRQAFHPEVIDPIIAWMLACYVRPDLPQFPVLAVQGGSGTGKSTLIKEVAQVIWGMVYEAGLSNSTAHGVAGPVAGSNALPIWFDEYREGARHDGMRQLEAMIRDAYDGRPSRKGGVDQTNLSKVVSIPTLGPIILSGEMSTQETSLIDRSVRIHLKKAEQGTLYKRGVTAAHSLRDFIESRYPYSNWYVIPVRTEGLRDRQAYNVGVLKLGWELWQDYCEYNSYDPGPPFAFGRQIDTYLELNTTTPLKDMLLEAWGDDYARADIFPGKFLVKQGALIKWAQERGTLGQLGTKRDQDIAAMFEEELGAVKERRSVNGAQVRVWVLPPDIHTEITGE